MSPLYIFIRSSIFNVLFLFISIVLINCKNQNLQNQSKVEIKNNNAGENKIKSGINKFLNNFVNKKKEKTKKTNKKASVNKKKLDSGGFFSRIFHHSSHHSNPSPPKKLIFEGLKHEIETIVIPNLNNDILQRIRKIQNSLNDLKNKYSSESRNKELDKSIRDTFNDKANKINKIIIPEYKKYLDVAQKFKDEFIQMIPESEKLILLFGENILKYQRQKQIYMGIADLYSYKIFKELLDIHKALLNTIYNFKNDAKQIVCGPLLYSQLDPEKYKQLKSKKGITIFNKNFSNDVNKQINKRYAPSEEKTVLTTELKDINTIIDKIYDNIVNFEDELFGNQCKKTIHKIKKKVHHKIREGKIKKNDDSNIKNELHKHLKDELDGIKISPLDENVIDRLNNILNQLNGLEQTYILKRTEIEESIKSMQKLIRVAEHKYTKNAVNVLIQSEETLFNFGKNILGNDKVSRMENQETSFNVFKELLDIHKILLNNILSFTNRNNENVAGAYVYSKLDPNNFKSLVTKNNKSLTKNFSEKLFNLININSLPDNQRMVLRPEITQVNELMQNLYEDIINTDSELIGGKHKSTLAEKIKRKVNKKYYSNNQYNSDQNNYNDDQYYENYNDNSDSSDYNDNYQDNNNYDYQDNYYNNNVDSNYNNYNYQDNNNYNSSQYYSNNQDNNYSNYQDNSYNANYQNSNY